MELSHNILFTGAGFTANFGGFLAKEMWAIIFNNSKLKSHPAIKTLLKDDFDFESIYSKVTNSSDFSDEEKSAFHEIIRESYSTLDDIIKNYNFTGTDPYGVNIYGIRELLNLFSRNGTETGIHFTLNQDLFMERQFSRQPFGFVGLKYKDYLQTIQSKRIDPESRIQIPGKAELDEFAKNSMSNCGDFYAKLHGSHGWLSVNGGDQMVLGTGKSEEIQKEPLLNFYFDLFEKALFRDDVKILIIGYGFRDKHINNYLVKAIQDHNLKLYIISTEGPEAFKDKLIGKPKDSATLWAPDEDGQIIWNAIDAYFPFKMKEIYPADQSKNPIQRNIVDLFR
jgi:hypothetical protein